MTKKPDFENICVMTRGKGMSATGWIGIATASLMLLGCPTSGADEPTGTALHNLDDRVRLLECRRLNEDVRIVFGESTESEDGAEDALDYDEKTIEHDEREIEHDEGTIEHDEATIEHDEGTIKHDEGTIEHDEVFKKLVSCRRDTLELRKKYLACTTEYRQCKHDGGLFKDCQAKLQECIARTHDRD